MRRASCAFHFFLVNCGTNFFFQRTRKMITSTEKVSSQETGEESIRQRIVGYTVKMVNTQNRRNAHAPRMETIIGRRE